MILKHETVETGRTVKVMVEMETAEEANLLHALIDRLKWFVDASHPEGVRKFFDA